LGTIALNNCEGLLEGPEGNKKNLFMIVTKPRTYKIVASSRHEMAEWMVSIKGVIDTLSTQARPRSIEGFFFFFFFFYIYKKGEE